MSNAFFNVQASYAKVSSFPQTWTGTQAWSVGCALKFCDKSEIISYAVICTQANASPFPTPLEVYIDPNGVVNVRVIHSAITPSWIWVTGTTNVCDNNIHYVWATYDGSKTAAGVTIYVDGVAESLTVQSDTLGANSAISANVLYIGAQQNSSSPAYYPMQYVGPLRVDNTVRSSGYIAAASSSGTFPPSPDTNSVVAFNWTAGSGTTETDLSTNGFNATMANAFSWVNLPDTNLIVNVQNITTGFPSSSSARTFTLPHNTVAGNLIVVSVATNGTSVTVTVGDTVNTYTQAGSYTTNGTTKQSIWYAKNIAGGAVTVTITPSAAAYVSATITEYSGADRTSPLVSTQNATGTSTAPATSAVTVNQQGTLLVGSASIGSTQNFIFGGTSCVCRGNVIGTGFQNYGYVDNTAVASSTAAVLTLQASGAWAAIGATFNARYIVSASGPSGGLINKASTNFTVSLASGQAFNGSTTITISDGSNGGTITPSVGSPGTSSVTVTPTANATSFTFTYTPATTGAITLSFTNAQTWTNPSNLMYQVTNGGGSGDGGCGHYYN